MSVKTGEWVQPTGEGGGHACGRVQRSHPVRIDEHTGMVFAQVGGGDACELPSDKHNVPETPRSVGTTRQASVAFAARKRQAVAAVSHKQLQASLAGLSAATSAQHPEAGSGDDSASGGDSVGDQRWCSSGADDHDVAMQDALPAAVQQTARTSHQVATSGVLRQATLPGVWNGR